MTTSFPVIIPLSFTCYLIKRLNSLLMTGVYDFSFCVYKTMSGNWDFKIYMSICVKVPSSAFIKLAAPPRMAKNLTACTQNGPVVQDLGQLLPSPVHLWC